MIHQKSGDQFLLSFKISFGLPTKPYLVHKGIKTGKNTEPKGL